MNSTHPCCPITSTDGAHSPDCPAEAARRAEAAKLAPCPCRAGCPCRTPAIVFVPVPYAAPATLAPWLTGGWPWQTWITTGATWTSADVDPGSNWTSVTLDVRAAEGTSVLTLTPTEHEV